MLVLHTIQQARDFVEELNGSSLGHFHTLGEIHQGHLELIEYSIQRYQRTIVSIFEYPPSGEPLNVDGLTPSRVRDLSKLEHLPIDAVFIPTVNELFPLGLDRHIINISVPALSSTMCGRIRPGIYSGVMTIMCKMLNVLTPDVTVMGEKDWQQNLIVQRMTTDLNMSTEVVIRPTVRESDGLALSSRNSLLTASERQQAPAVYQALHYISSYIRSIGKPDCDLTDQIAFIDSALTHNNIKLDYLEVLDSTTLQHPTTRTTSIVIAISAYLGFVRLTDCTIQDITK